MGRLHRLRIVADDGGPGWGIIPAVALVLAIVIGMTVVCSYFWSSHTCGRRADRMGLQHNYGFWTECMVRQNASDPWVPLDDVRVQAGELYTDDEKDEG